MVGHVSDQNVPQRRISSPRSNPRASPRTSPNLQKQKNGWDGCKVRTPPEFKAKKSKSRSPPRRTPLNSGDGTPYPAKSHGGRSLSQTKKSRKRGEGETARTKSQTPQTPQLVKRKSNLEIELSIRQRAKWQEKKFPELHDLPKYGARGMCDSITSAFIETNNYYIKIEMLETRESHKTIPITHCESSFAVDESLDNHRRFSLGCHKDASELTLRVVIMDSVLGQDKLLGFAKCRLERLVDGGKAKKKKKKTRAKKSSKTKKKWRKILTPQAKVAERNRDRVMYVAVPTTNKSADTGTVFLHLDYRPKKGYIQVTVLGAKDVHRRFDWKDEEEENRAFGIQELFIAVFLVVYIVASALVMNAIEGNNDPDCALFDNFRECLWFVLVTFASVGYGDMYPCTDEGMIANSFLIITNQLTLAWFFSIAAQLFLMQSEAFQNFATECWRFLRNAEHDRHIFKAGDEVYTRDDHTDLRTAVVENIIKDFDEDTREWAIEYELYWVMDPRKVLFTRREEQVRDINPLTEEKLFSQLLHTLAKTGSLVMLMSLLGMLFFRWVEKDSFKEEYGFELTYANTFHFSLVTMATVGYGDWAPTTTEGRAFGAFFILGGVTLLANFAGIVVKYFLQREQLLNSQEFLNNSLVTPQQILDFDMDGDGEVSKFEYLVKSLQACKFVKEDKIDLIMAKFYDIDTDKSGQISMEDFVEYAELRHTIREGDIVPDMHSTVGVQGSEVEGYIGQSVVEEKIVE